MSHREYVALSKHNWNKIVETIAQDPRIKKELSHLKVETVSFWLDNDLHIEIGKIAK